MSDTIAAIATARGEASVGVVRVSGPEAVSVIAKMFRRPSGNRLELVKERSLFYGLAVHPQTEAILDEVILLWMPGPRSYTGEDVVEFQVHGGVRVIDSILEAVIVAGARIAEPGEFTKRAFLNGRIDLSQAEAVIDLIRAKTTLASTVALRQMRGGLRDKITALRKQLLRLEAYVEVSIDYPEHDIEDEARMQVADVCHGLLSEVEDLLSKAAVGQVLRDGVGTVILGRPNVGKSSLLNRLLRRDRAIVTDIPGTTRDVLEEYVNLGGIPFRLVDTAGIRETEDVVERIGVTRSRESLEEAEIVVLMLNGSVALTDEDVQLLKDTRDKHRLIVVNKADLEWSIDMSALQTLAGDSAIYHVSSVTGEGLAQLEQALIQMAVGDDGTGFESALTANQRQSQYLREAANDLSTAIHAASVGATLDIIAVQLQAAYASLGMVIGEEVGEDLLDEIFSQFCLGK